MAYKSVLKISAQLALVCCFMAISQASPRLCSTSIATSTMYFVPDVRDYCKGSSVPCKRFKKEVRLQGSGTLPGGKTLKYTGKVIDMKGCDTAIGASGNCLIPFISVAADPRYYSMGDIIQMPSLRGKMIELPNGKLMRHPGYFIVQDTGGAIRGQNRFDFFTGSYSAFNANNIFGFKGSRNTRMVDKSECSDDKRFSVVRRGSISYEGTLASIQDAITDSIDTRVASTSHSRFPAEGAQ